jgi:hypothetical protein
VTAKDKVMLNLLKRKTLRMEYGTMTVNRFEQNRTCQELEDSPDLVADIDGRILA